MLYFPPCFKNYIFIIIPEKTFSIFFPFLLKVLHLFFIYLFFASKGKERRENIMIVYGLFVFFFF